MATLGYWNTRGLAQPIRLLLNYVGEEFDDVHYSYVGEGPDFSREQWHAAREKLNLDFPNLPYYIDEEVSISQSNAILRHLGRKYMLDGVTEREKAEVDMLLEQEMDMRLGVIAVTYSPDYETIKTKYFEDVLPRIDSFEKFIGEKPWIVGDKVTVADFHLYELMDELRLMKKDILDQYPKIRTFLDRFEELPAISKYMASEKFLRYPINNKNATFRNPTE